MKVLVAIDNKPSSQAIIDALIKMHWADGTEMHVITVRHAHHAHKFADRAEEEAISHIEQLAVELHQTLATCDVTFLALEGEPKHVIVDTANQLGAELIVMGSNCKNTLERLLLGSVSQSVIKEAHCPVIVAKTPCCLAREASPAFKNILIPMDNSVYSDLVITWMSKFHWSPDSRFILCAAVEEDTKIAAVKERLRDQATKLAKLLGSNNVVFDIELGEAEERILALASQYYVDLIAIGSHGRHGLKKYLHGNVAQTISQEAPCAVAVIRGLAPDDESWFETGAFEKEEAAPAVDAYRRYEDEKDQVPGIWPGSIG